MSWDRDPPRKHLHQDLRFDSSARPSNSGYEDWA